MSTAEKMIREALTYQEYSLIRNVHNNHPSISEGEKGWEEIYYILTKFGRQVLFDMVKTANRALDIQQRLRHLEAERRELEAELHRMSKNWRD